MESPVLGVVLDSSMVITAERKSLPVPQLVEAIQTTYGEIELSLSPVTVAELVHGIYRAKTPAVSERRREYIDELVKLMPPSSNHGSDGLPGWADRGPGGGERKRATVQ